MSFKDKDFAQITTTSKTSATEDIRAKFYHYIFDPQLQSYVVYSICSLLPINTKITNLHI